MKKYLSTKLVDETPGMKPAISWSILLDEDGGSVTGAVKNHGIPKNFRNFEKSTVYVQIFPCTKFLFSFMFVLLFFS